MQPNNEDSLDRLGYALRGLKRYGEALTIIVCLKESLEIRFKAISKVMSSYRMHNPNGMDENDLCDFMKFVCGQS